MTPREVAAKAGVTSRSVNRWINQYKEETGLEEETKADVPIEDEGLINFLETKIQGKGSGRQAPASKQKKPNKDKSEQLGSLGRDLFKRPEIENPFEWGQKETVIPEIKYEDPPPNGSPGLRSIDPDELLQKLDRMEREIEEDALAALERELEREDEIRKSWTFRRFLSVLPLPMLGLAASYGVYHFSLMFVPQWVAIVEASAFELTYIGLAALDDLDEKGKKMAVRVSIGAVAVSIIYNSVAGASYFRPELFVDLSLLITWTIAILHGVPLAILGYFVSRLVLHNSDK